MSRLLTGTPPPASSSRWDSRETVERFKRGPLLEVRLAVLRHEKWDKILHASGLFQLKNFTLVFQTVSSLDQLAVWQTR
jgi:hypothetical protein